MKILNAIKSLFKRNPKQNRDGEIKQRALTAKSQVMQDLQFLIDIGSYKTRQKYVGTKKEFESAKTDAMGRIIGNIIALSVITDVLQDMESMNNLGILEKCQELIEQVAEQGRVPEGE